MVRRSTTITGKPIARWLLNATLFICLVFSSEVTHQPQPFQSYHTELAIAANEASSNTVAYQTVHYKTDVKTNDNHRSFDSFVNIQLHHTSCIRARLKEARLDVSPFDFSVLYLQFQSSRSIVDEDYFISIRG